DTRRVSAHPPTSSPQTVSSLRKPYNQGFMTVSRSLPWTVAIALASLACGRTDVHHCGGPDDPRSPPGSICTAGRCTETGTETLCEAGKLRCGTDECVSLETSTA